MKKVFACLAALALLLVCCLPAIAATPSVPDWLNGAVANSFDDLASIAYGSGWQNHDVYDGTGALTAEVVDFNGGKAMKFSMTSNYTDVLRVTNGGRTAGSAWPAATDTPEGIFLHVATGANPVSFRMGFQLALKENVFTDVAAGTSFRCYPGISTTDVVRLYQVDGTEIAAAVNDKNGYDATVTVPANFDGYLVYDFTTLYVEGGGSYAPVNGTTNYYQKVAKEDVQWFGSSFNYTIYFTEANAGTYLILDDFGYLNPDSTPSPTPTATPTPTPTPTAAPTTASPTATPTTVAPTATPEPAPAGGAVSMLGTAVAMLAAGAVMIRRKHN